MIRSLTVATLALAACSGLAQKPNPTTVRTIPLWPTGSKASIDIYAPLSHDSHHTLVVILPGGGFGMLSPADRLLAEFFRGEGYPAAVINYRTLPLHYPAAANDVLRAMRELRATEMKPLHTDRIALLGESAGGMLAAIVAVEPDLTRDPNDDLAASVSARPDLVIMISPVISAVSEHRNVELERWLGPHADERESISPELHVTPQAAPALIFHAADDPIVPYQGSLALAQAYWKVGGDATLHIFPKGGHGYRFYNATHVSRAWKDLTLLWLEAHEATPAEPSPASTAGSAR